MNEISAENRNFIMMKKITKNIIIDIEVITPAVY